MVSSNVFGRMSDDVMGLLGLPKNGVLRSFRSFRSFRSKISQDIPRYPEILNFTHVGSHLDPQKFFRGSLPMIHQDHDLSPEMFTWDRPLTGIFRCEFSV